MRGTQFTELSAFVEIAERRSFAKAAAQLGVSRSTLSQNLRALEERLGVRLLNRTTRSVFPTEVGERLLTRVRPALQELAGSLLEVDSFRGLPAGQLRIVVQPPVAAHLVGPLMGRFLEQYPAIRLQISVEKMPADIVSTGFDAGIRIGEQIERDMVAMRVIGETQFVTVAAPKYIAQHSRPKTPRDLQHHNCIRALLPNGTVFGWEFEQNGRPVQAVVNGSLIVDDIDLVIRAALEGVGIAYVMHDFVKPHIKNGQLVRVLEPWTPRLSGFYLYHSSRRLVTAPLRAFIDFLKIETRSRAVPSTVLHGKTPPIQKSVRAARR